MAKLYGLKPVLNNSNLKKNSNQIEFKITGLRPGEKLYEELLIDNNSKQTKHPRILTTQESSISKNKLKNLLKDLHKSCTLNDLDKIKFILKKAPIEFNPDMILNDSTID